MYDFGIRQALTGYRVAYRPEQQNYCPGCGGSHWVIGRFTAECAFAPPLCRCWRAAALAAG